MINSRAKRLPAEWINDRGQVWLNVGSGPYVEPRHVNLDNHVFMPLRRLYPLLARLVPRERARHIEQFHLAGKRALLVRWDCRKPLQLPPDSIDHILCSHFLEHVYPDQAEVIVRGFFRVMKPGGTLHVIVPDLGALARAYLASNGAGRAAHDFVAETLLTRSTSPSLRYRALEALGYEGLQHRWMYDEASLRSLLRDAGFESLAGNDTPSAHVRKDDRESLHAVAVKPTQFSG